MPATLDTTTAMSGIRAALPGYLSASPTTIGAAPDTIPAKPATIPATLGTAASFNHSYNYGRDTANDEGRYSDGYAAIDPSYNTSNNDSYPSYKVNCLSSNVS